MPHRVLVGRFHVTSPHLEISLPPIAFCEVEVADGFRWPRTMENIAAELPCSSAGSFFRRETRAIRQCLNGGRWGVPDLTTCTLQQDSEPFLLIWFVLDLNVDSGGTSPEPTDDGTLLEPAPEMSLDPSDDPLDPADQTPERPTDGTPGDQLLEAEVGCCWDIYKPVQKYMAHMKNYKCNRLKAEVLVEKWVI